MAWGHIERNRAAGTGAGDDTAQRARAAVVTVNDYGRRTVDRDRESLWPRGIDSAIEHPAVVLEGDGDRGDAADISRQGISERAAGTDRRPGREQARIGIAGHINGERVPGRISRSGGDIR